MNKQAARYGFYFYIITMIIAFAFPNQVFGNMFVLGSYLFICLTFIYFIYYKKAKKESK